MNNLQTIFVGSTISDLHDYRVRVEKALKDENLIVHLSEDWVGGYDDTVARCRQRLHQTDGYLGIFAYFYGSVPPGHDLSITHLEFHWSLEKWGASACPRIAVFMPGTAYPLPVGQECEAKRELRQRAAACLAQLSKKKRFQHDTRLQRFHLEVTQSAQWRTVNWFHDLAELLVRAVQTCHLWRGDLLAIADAGASGRGSSTASPRVPTPDELGCLGRLEHLNACKDVLAQLQFASPAVPAGAIVVCGDEDAGHGHFLDAVLKLPPLGGGRPPRWLRPPIPGYGLHELVQSVASEVVADVSGRQPIATLEELAESLHAALMHQAITLIIDQIGQLEGGLPRFQRDFWRPLFEGLAALRTNAKGHRLLLLIPVYTELEGTYQPTIARWKEGEEITDFRHLITLPVLTDFTEADVRRWMFDLAVPDEPLGHRKRILQAVLTNPRGQPDGTPLRVFERLRRERLWPEESA